MTTKSAKGKAAKSTARKVRTSTARAAAPKTAPRKVRIKDPVGRYVDEHWGALGKDYKLVY